ncbi:hypothetical protein J2Z37_004333 [Ammoniphilus resinae]|uniref:Uncharacterized protein n=1 Tax=Ammoniphilus resinae TaxID=861532 RepID=A0ABS4GVL2_9BACL|nr:hypothetical protein [Ammoniphilus resinae]
MGHECSIQLVCDNSLVSVFQGNPVTRFDLLGIVLIVVALLSNNLFARTLHKKKSIQHVQTNLRERTASGEIIGLRN